MAELEPGHPDELVQLLTSWLNASQSKEGTLLPEGIQPVEWAVRQFINSWKGPIRIAVDAMEGSLARAIALCSSGSPLVDIMKELEDVRQTLQEDLRDELGLYDWNNT